MLFVLLSSISFNNQYFNTFKGCNKLYIDYVRKYNLTKVDKEYFCEIVKYYDKGFRIHLPPFIVYNNKYQPQTNTSEVFDSLDQKYQQLTTNAVNSNSIYKQDKFRHKEQYEKLIEEEEEEMEEELVIEEIEMVEYCLDTHMYDVSSNFSQFDFSRLPASVDLREHGLITRIYDQQQCGSCTLFVGTQNAEAAILRDFQYYFKNRNFANSTGNISVSVDFFLSNSISNSACDGANYYFLMRDIARVMQTMETASNFPYDYRKDYVPVSPKINKTDYITPFFNTQTKKVIIQHKNKIIVNHITTNCNSNIVYLKTYSKQQMTKTHINILKHALAHGISVQGSICTTMNDVKKRVKFQKYSNGILEGSCDNNTADHAVNIIGYGKFKNKEVWIFRNSWGEQWGKKGIFMVEIGKNTYCTEMEVILTLPRGITYQELLGNNYYTQKQNDYFWLNKSFYTQKRGIDGLDDDNGFYQNEPLLNNNIFIIISSIGFGIWIIITVIFNIIKCVKNKKSKSKQNLDEE